MAERTPKIVTEHVAENLRFHIASHRICWRVEWSCSSIGNIMIYASGASNPIGLGLSAYGMRGAGSAFILAGSVCLAMHILTVGIARCSARLANVSNRGISDHATYGKWEYDAESDIAVDADRSPPTAFVSVADSVNSVATEKI